MTHRIAAALSTVLFACAAFAAGPQSIRFRLTQSETERWPEPVTIVIKESVTASSRNVELSSRLVTKPYTLQVAPGTYELSFKAPHHRPVERIVTVGAADVDLGRLTLVRYPVLTGSVRTADGSPIVGALVTDRARLSGKTDDLGAFALEVDGDWPSWIEVSYPGLTTKEMAVPKAQSSSTLPAVTLFKGSRIAIAIEGLTEEVDVDLAIESGYKRIHVVKTVHVGSGDGQAAFEDLDRGTYIAIIRGHGPLQRLGTEIVVDESQSVKKTIRIDPLAVELEVLRGDSPAAGAVVTVKSDRWMSDELRTDSDGRIHTQAWERGSSLFAVRVGEKSPPVLLVADIEGKSEASVRLEVPDRRISGRVIDAESGAPVANATVNVESTNDDESGGTMQVVADTDGRFIIEGLRDGSHALAVEAESYVRSEPTRVRVDQTLPRRDVSLRVSRGASRALRVMTRGGAPIRRATVIATLGDSVTGLFETDPLGQVTIRTPPGGTPVVFVVPAEGSFSVTRLRSARSESEEAIVVPDGIASLELNAKDSNGKPIPHLQFVMRYDGELIPPDVADLLMVRRGIAAMTGVDGVARLEHLPAGFLELWPVRGSDELHDIIAGGATAAPVQIALKEGLNVASMTFARRK